jgi:hypothetical protein
MVVFWVGIIMMKFSKKLTVGTDPDSGRSVLGFEHKGMFILDPFRSDCGRFEVHPGDAYDMGVSEAQRLLHLNQAIEDAAMAALDLGCRHIQEFLGVESGDYASHYYSGDGANGMSLEMAKYAESELEFGEHD